MVIPIHEHDDGAAHTGRAVVAAAHVTGVFAESPKVNPLIP
jgi:hypothetical protein